ncbi:hypothetical protein [Nitrospina gracilis]|uniref:hypothetical protein n=1 Tax=Nitrospina gracilis TaxID=35801 RepID=UPI001F2095D8|nr:hypothetical protein [Nitrospina gracilis]MCF8721839.1 uncharacterized protein YjeT (DUF2065 family) [Nitrospina gracilis Nb-211]
MEQRAKLWGPLLVAASGVFMVSIGWLKWPDLMIDYGAQLYLPWQIAEGRVLYRDLFYLYGPLSSHVHALLFLMFGTGFHVLVWFNLLLVAVLAGLIFALFRRMADHLTAALGALSFVVVFALAQYQGGGNFNFVAPYNYELTHGVALGFVALFLFHSYATRPATVTLMGLGLVTGLVFLTKPEAFLALFSAMMVGLPLALHFQAGPFRIKLLKGLLWTASFCAAPFLFWAYLSLRMPAETAFLGLIGPWLHVLDPFTRTLPLYQWMRGMDDLSGNVMKGVGYALGWAAVLALIGGMHRLLNKTIPHTATRYSGGVLLFLGVLTAWWAPVPWLELGRPLPLFVLGYGLCQAWKLKRPSSDQIGHSLFLLVFSVYAFVLMLKIIFNVHVYHYGFALALPAFLLFVRFFIHDFSRRLGAAQNSFSFARTMSAALILMFVVAHGHVSYKLYPLRNYPVGSGMDTILEYYPFLNPRGAIVNEAVNYMQNEMEPQAEFPVFPAGNMLNYLSRHPNPFPFIFFTPPEVHFYGEGAYLERLQSQPPPYIVFVEMDNSWLGAPYFGRDYAQNLYAWVMKHYRQAALFGDPPFTGKGYGIQILKYSPQTTGKSS